MHFLKTKDSSAVCQVGAFNKLVHNTVERVPNLICALWNMLDSFELHIQAIGSSVLCFTDITVH